MKLKIKKGLELPLAGAIAAGATPSPSNVTSVAICPDDFPGFTPKPDVATGDVVKCGQPLMHDKNYPEIKLVSPVSGVVADVVRGERRHLERIVVRMEGKDCVTYSRPSDRAGSLDLLCRSGLLAMMRTRPYDRIPTPDVTPRDIFVTAFDSAPLAWQPESYDVARLQAGIDVLSLLTDGKIYVSRREGSAFPALDGVENVSVSGPHPAGLVGVQIANLAPVNKGECVWTLSSETLYRIGSLMVDGRPDWSTTVAVTGPMTETPELRKAVVGCAVSDILPKTNIKSGAGHVRIISGNVLTGVKVGADGFLHYPYTQLTVIAEGDDVNQFMGWASLSPKSLSTSTSFPGHFLRRVFSPDARLLGGRRAMIQSGEYDKVLPMDIMLEYLIKAINAGDIDAMEQLGIYEIAPEDVALAEFADSSKQPLQNIIRKGIDTMIKES